jgi:superfamily II DNA or RNA helicase
MKAMIADSMNMPTRTSYYLTDFSEETLDELKKSAPFSYYHRALKKYEVTKQVLESLSEHVEVVGDVSAPVVEFERKHKEKYGYQLDAVEFSKTHKSIMLNFAQGMGKSLTTMMILEQNKVERTLIICGQSNLQEEWLKDARKHNRAEELDMQIVGKGDCSSAAKVKWIQQRGLSRGTDLINVEALRNDRILDALIARKYQCIVVDEVQTVKGWKALQTKGLQMLPREEGQMRIALSGTPVLNSPLEFFSVLRFLSLLDRTARTTFERYYGVWTFDFWGHYICTGYRNMPELAELLKPVICTADKSELGLPVKTRKLVRVELGEAKAEYDYLKKCYKMTIRRLNKEGFKSKAEVRAKMMFLSCTAEGKLSNVMELAKKGKTLVFSQYTTVLEKYRELLQKQGIRVGYYTGELSMVARLQVLNDWHEGKYDALLLSVNAARYGLNLTEANQVVFIEPPTSLLVLEQAEDRSHRIGQERPVSCYLLSATEIDESMLNAIKNKQNSIEQLKDELS